MAAAAVSTCDQADIDPARGGAQRPSCLVSAALPPDTGEGVTDSQHVTQFTLQYGAVDRWYHRAQYLYWRGVCSDSLHHPPLVTQ